ncbi:hypothetical protein [Azospirillum brasilense]|uniref:Helix-turn-helix domain-containing protein n=1 Tax=Azospirillum brasilense TaxID=192 RepID=A0A6L3AR42_AZOBR|nr:hypothetical protein [Azospirillum brasilense]KAA0676526.1 hypothetical protein DS837_30675 [Azospirillum brasilense]
MLSATATPRPKFGTPAYYAAISAGSISWEDADQDWQRVQERRQHWVATPTPRRVFRDRPVRKRQYARAMATTVARDSRISSGAVRLLVILRAMCGERGFVATTNAALCDAVEKSPATIKRWLRELRGDLPGGIPGDAYVTTDIIREGGVPVGIYVELTKLVQPFYENITSRQKPAPELSTDRSNLSDVKTRESTYTERMLRRCQTIREAKAEKKAHAMPAGKPWTTNARSRMAQQPTSDTRQPQETPPWLTDDGLDPETGKVIRLFGCP